MSDTRLRVTVNGNIWEGGFYSPLRMRMIQASEARGDKPYVLKAFVGQRKVRQSTAIGAQTMMRIACQRLYDERYAILQDGDKYILLDLIEDADIDARQMVVHVNWESAIRFDDYDAAVAAAVMQGD